MKIFENVQQLKLAKLKAGQLVETKGFYTAGDGGQARYLIIMPTVADNFGDHTLANGNVAKLQSGVKNVLQYGAGTSGDVSANFLAADSASNESTYVPAITYDVSSGDFTGKKFHSFGAPTISAGTITILNLNP